jgi:polysaccharide export outer membrane protein
MASKTRLLELIVKAGGVSDAAGNVALIIRGAAEKVRAGEKVEVLASQTEPIRANIYHLLHKGDLSANLELEPGDVVYIPPKMSLNVSQSKIYVDGEVNSPGPFDYQPGMTVYQACLLAGGFSKFAAPHRTRIIRQKGDQVKTIKINLNRVSAGKTPDIELQPGDRVHVPETWL